MSVRAFQAAPEGTRFYEVPKGTWLRVVLDGQATARIGCPTCGECPALGDHEIAPDGTVTPSAVCPTGCGFHEHVKLEGWEPEKVVEW